MSRGPDGRERGNGPAIRSATKASRGAAIANPATGAKALEEWLQSQAHNTLVGQSVRDCADALAKGKVTPRIALLVMVRLDLLVMPPRSCASAVSLLSLPDSFANRKCPLAAALSTFWLYRRPIADARWRTIAAGDDSGTELVVLPRSRIEGNRAILARLKHSESKARDSLDRDFVPSAEGLKYSRPLWPSMKTFNEAKDGTTWLVNRAGDDPPFGLHVRLDEIGEYKKMLDCYLGSAGASIDECDEAFSFGHYSIGTWLQGTLTKTRDNEGTLESSGLCQSLVDRYRFDAPDPVGAWPPEVEEHGRTLLKWLMDVVKRQDGLAAPDFLWGANVNLLTNQIRGPVNRFLDGLRDAQRGARVSEDRLHCRPFDVRTTIPVSHKITYRVALAGTSEEEEWTLTPHTCDTDEVDDPP